MNNDNIFKGESEARLRERGSDVKIILEMKLISKQSQFYTHHIMTK